MTELLPASDLIDALERSDPVLETCWNAVDAPILALDRAGRIRLCNRACAALFEYDRSEIEGQSAIDLLVAPEERTAIRATLEALQAEPTEVHRTVTCLTQSGDRRRVRWTGRSLGAEGQVRAIVATGVDVTGRHAGDPLSDPAQDHPLRDGASGEGATLDVPPGDDPIPRQPRVADVQDKLLEEIGDELHDGVVSHLAGTAMYAEVLHRKMCDGTATSEEGERLVRYLREGVSQARQLAHRFAAQGVDRAHFPSALRKLAELAERQSAVTVQCDIAAHAVLPSDVAAKHLYRIAQEAMINAVRHGRPDRIEIRAVVDAEMIRLDVLDDGAGLDPDAEPGVGMRSMQERAERLGGTLAVEARPCGGTAVRCVVSQPDGASEQGE